MYKDIIKNMNIVHTEENCKEEYLFEKNIALGTKQFENSKNKPLTYKIDNNSYTIIYTGKLYNYDIFKKELKENGFTFSTDLEEEVIVKGFVHFGYDICKKLNGAFSFAIWNQKREELFLARDHFGLKPLYYTFSNNSFIFASYIKCILNNPEVECKIDSMRNL